MPNTSGELLGMASNPCADALADLITVIATPIPLYTNIGSIPPHYYNSIKGKNTHVKSFCAPHTNVITA